MFFMLKGDEILIICIKKDGQVIYQINHITKTDNALVDNPVDNVELTQGVD